MVLSFTEVPLALCYKDTDDCSSSPFFVPDPYVCCDEARGLSFSFY